MQVNETQQSPEREPQIEGQLLFDQGAKTIWEKIVFTTNGAKTGYPFEKYEL